MQDYFFSLAETITPALRGREVVLCSLVAEDSDFVRFNQGRVRQAGTVIQRELTLDLVADRRHAGATLALTGDFAADRQQVELLVRDLRARREQVPEDPYLLYATEVHSTTHERPNRLPPGPEAVSEVLRVARGRDLVGLYAAGATYAGFANSLGQRNWSSSYSYNLDWSFHLPGGRAVKASYAGLTWSAAELERRAAAAAEQLELLSRPARRLCPGHYRTYLAPAALFELFELLAWGGFGLRAHRTKTTPLLRMIEGGARLHPAVTILENTAEGIAPEFEEAGFLRPERLNLIERGALRDCLVSPRSSVEYGVPTNGATAGETPQSLEVAGGDLPVDRVLQQLGTGIFVGNLWYLNFSDRSACRMTGMTRFATFWVNRGVAEAPLLPLRFDDTLYRMLGEQLAGLTRERELIFDPDTYGRRSRRTARLPGALLGELAFSS